MWGSDPPRSSRVLGSALAALLVGSGVRAEIRPGYTIGVITIEVHDVFDTTVPPDDKRPFKLANGLHRNTRDEVIRRELLFAPGDPYDPDLVEETERNLRRLSFVRGTECIATVDSGGTVDVLVRTYDSWTLQAITSFRRAGGQAIWRVGLVDHNLLGEGKDLTALFSRDDTTSTTSLAWKDPYFLGSKLDYWMSAVLSPNNSSYSIGLERPFYASIVRSAFGMNGNYSERHVTTFVGEAAVGTVRKRTRELGVRYGVAIGTSPRRNRHLTVGLLHHGVSYAAIPGISSGPTPNGERLEFLQLGAEWEVLDFVKERRIQKYSHFEDINLGLGIFASVAWAPRLGSVSSTASQFLPNVMLRKGFRWTARHLVLLNGAYSSTYSDGGNSNRIVSMDASYFLRVLPRQTLAWHANYDHGWRLDPAAPLTLGESNGLRGYSVRQFAGNRRVIFNIEDRIFIRDEVWRAFDLGAVVFYDSGHVWPASDAARFSDLKSSLGFGLRLAPSRSSSNSPLRIDIAYALGGNRWRSPWSLSILSGHAFGPGSN